jgi:hypothetical protein
VTLFWAANAAMPTTAAPAPTATASGCRTYLQISTPATRGLALVAFGVSFSGALTVATTVEAVDTAAIGATALTAHVAAGVQPYGIGALGATAPVSVMTLGTGNTGWAAGGATEGAIVATRTGKLKILPVGANDYEWEWSQGREFVVGPSRFLRLRLTTTTTAPTVSLWALWDE